MIDTNVKALLRKRHKGDTSFRVVLFLFCVVVGIVILYPLYFVIIASFSDPVKVASGQVVLFPLGITWKGYEMLFTNSNIWTGYRNTLLYTFLGTSINMVLTLPAAYTLSRREFMPRRLVMFLLVFTMYFSGGLIPTYLLIKELHMLNTVSVFLIPFSLNVYNLIIVRTFFSEGIPEALFDSAQIDGCSHIRYFFSIALPLSKSIIAVIALYYAVGHWNDYFTGLVYVRNNDLKPLQNVLRDILLISEASAQTGSGFATMYAQSIKYSAIIVSTIPLMIVYPFLQKYFEKGVMLGAVKG